MDIADEVVVLKESSVIPEIADLAGAFIGTCVQNLPRLDKIRAYARSSGFEPLQEDMLLMLGPIEPGVKTEGWVATTSNGQRYMLGITEGALDGVLHKNCAIAYKTENAEQLSREIVSLLDAKLDNNLSQSAGGQRYRAWRYTNLDESFLLFATDAPRLAPEILTMAANHQTR